jgi:signal transduction histidine kinase
LVTPRNPNYSVFMNRFKSLFEFGISDSEDLIELHKQRMLNLFVLLFTPFILLTLGVNLYNSKFDLAIINSIQVTIFGFAIWISPKKQFAFLRSCILVLLTIITFYVAVFFKNGAEYRLLVLMVVGAVIFDKNWKYIVFACFITLIFSYCRYLNFLENSLDHQLVLYRVAQIFISFVLTCISLLYFKNIYIKSQLKLQIALKEVSDSNSVKERFMYSLAHDLRSPISNVIGITKIMRLEGDLNAEQLRWLDLIESSSVNSSTLINELLDSNELLTKLESLELVDINGLVRDMVLLSQIKASEKQISIEFLGSSFECILSIDVLKMKRLISNLINNAIKFSHETQKIQVVISGINQQCQISIKDFGIGITPNQIPFIFDAFTKAKRKGTNNEASYGLGLSICKQIAQQHGGDITVTSELGKGSEFIVILPCVKS